MAIEIEETQQETTNTTGWQEPPDEQAARAQVFSRKKKRAEVSIPVPEWEMTVLIRAMSGTQRYRYEAIANHHSGDEDKERFYRDLGWFAVQMCCLHPKTQQPLFKPADQGNFLDDEGGALIEYLASLVLALSKMDTASREEARKNLNAVLHSVLIS